MRRTALRRVSAKRQAELAGPLYQRGGTLERRHRICEWPDCGHAFVGGPHHKLLRSRGGGHEIENLADLCPAHHRRVHDHPAEATEMGLMIPSWEAR